MQVPMHVQQAVQEAAGRQASGHSYTKAHLCCTVRHRIPHLVLREVQQLQRALAPSGETSFSARPRSSSPAGSA